MSLNQSRSSDSQFRKPGGGGGGGRGSGSGGQQRSFSGGRGRGGAGPTSNPAAPTSNTRSYKKVSNGQGGQSRANPGTVNVSDPNTASAAHSVENGGQSQSTLHGMSSTPSPGSASKPVDAQPQKSGRPVPRAPSSHLSTTKSDHPMPSPAAKGNGAIQFGSISPGFMNGVQVPPRTSSAPPKLDEQQRDQARRDSSRALPAIPLPSAPKQELPGKDAVLPGKPVTQQTHTESKVHKEVLAASASPPTQAQKPPSLPITGISLPMPFHQPTVSMPFGGHNPQIQSQSIPSSSLHPMQMPLQVGNPSQVPQQVFVPGLQHPLMQTPGIIQQGQNLGYSPQLATQLPHQMGNMGLNISTQFNQQPAGKFGGSQFGSGRKPVKITHPDTLEELRLDGRDVGSSGLRSHHSAPQNQPPPTYTPAHPMAFYSSNYTSGPPFFPVQTSLPLTSGQSNASSQGIRISHPVSQGQSNISVSNQPALKSFSAGKGGTSVRGSGEPSNPDNVRDVQHMAPPAQRSSTSVTVRAAGEKAISSIAAEKLDPSGLANSVTRDAELNLMSRSSNRSTTLPASVVTETSTPTALSVVPKTSSRPLASSPRVDAISKVTVPISVGSLPKEQDEKGHLQPAQQSDFKGLQDLDDSSKTAAAELTEAKLSSTSSELEDGKSEAAGVVSIVNDVAPDEAAAVGVDSGNSGESSESSDTQNAVSNSAEVQLGKQNNLLLQENVAKESANNEERGEQERLEGCSVADSLIVLDTAKGPDQVEHSERAGLVGSAVVATEGEANSLRTLTEGCNMPIESSSSENAAANVSDDCCSSDLNTLSGVTDSLSSKNCDASRSNMSGNKVLPPPMQVLETNAGLDKEGVDNPRPSSSAGSVSGSSTAAMESNKTKNRGKKKWKELLQKADALGTTADLYMAYKGPEERKETVAAPEVAVVANVKAASSDSELAVNIGEKKEEPSKVELDDWEDAADMSTPKLESSSKDGGMFLRDEEGVATKKYSRDFLLKFSEHCIYLPEGFEVMPDIADSLMRANVGAPRSDHDYSSTGRSVDRPGGVARLDRHGSGMMNNERWNKQQGPYPPSPDPRLDLAYGSNVMGFPANRGPIHGVLRNPRGQGPVQLTGAILPGPMPSLGFQGLQRNSSDADRWQRGTNFNKGLMPAPHTPAPPMHKAERKYEVGKVTDEEEAKQRKLKGILNKLTPQNFDKLFQQVEDLKIDNVITLTGVISQIFDKALMEPTFCEMYANFCAGLAEGLPDLIVDNEKITFRRLLLNKCQEEFERGEREEQEANNADGENDSELSEAEREEKRLKVRRRMLGNIRLIGELYKKKMLTERIMHECIKKLLGQDQNPDEENIEALCKLMSTIGEMIDHPRAKDHMDAYFDIMSQLSNNMKLSSRVRFMLKDSIDLRKNKWQQRRKVEGPKKINEVHQDAYNERPGQLGRINRGPGMNSSMRRGQPQDYGPRGSMLSPSIGAGVGFRGAPPQVRGFGQEVRVDERNLSVPLPQRSSPDEPITLGPQGGLARGMAFRGQPSVSSSSLLNNSQYYGDPRRMGGMNGYGTVPQRGLYGSREDQYMRNASDRFGASSGHDQSSREDIISSSSNRELRYPDPNVNRSRPVTPPVPRTAAALSQNNSLEKVRSEEQLQEMSIAAIREYYSAKDEKEVALCIKDLNDPSYYPTVVSKWVSDSFERRDLERGLLAKLLVKLTRPGDGTFNQRQLIQGFESVLTSLEDTVTDAPRAPEFLGRIFAEVVMENVVPLNEVGQLILHGGYKPGRLLEVGLAAEVLGSVLERIKSEKGESALNEIRGRSNLQLLDFLPDPVKCPKLEMFM